MTEQQSETPVTGRVHVSKMGTYHAEPSADCAWTINDTRGTIDGGPACEECGACGHGVVSEWTSRAKRPGERVMNENRRGSFRYYDVKATLNVALNDGWRAAGGELAGESKRACAARAVEADFERMRGWCHDEWGWVGVVVTLLDADGNKTHEADSLWGIESDAGDYLDVVAGELADEIIARLDGADVLTVPLRRRKDGAA